MTLGTDGCMKCEVMTGRVLGSWPGHSWSPGQDGNGQVTKTETQAFYTYTVKLRSSNRSIIASNTPVNFNVTPINECLMVK